MTPPDQEMAQKIAMLLAHEIAARLEFLNLLNLDVAQSHAIEEEISKVVRGSEACAKAVAFERLTSDLAGIMPVESRMKRLAGLPLAEALKGFVIVSADEWRPENRNNILR